MGVAAAPPNGFPASLSTVNSIRNAAANASAGDYTSVLHIGDISYAMGYQFYWPLFLDQIQPIASRAPYLLSIGPPPPLLIFFFFPTQRSRLSSSANHQLFPFLNQETMSFAGQASVFDPPGTPVSRALFAHLPKSQNTCICVYLH